MKPNGLSNSGGGVNRFLRFSTIYALGDLLTKGAQIVLLPYYISVLAPAEVGTVAILTTLVISMWHLTSFGLGFAIRRFYHDHEQGEADQFVYTLWIVRILVGLPFLGAAVIAAWYLHTWLGTSIAFYLIFLALLTGFLKGGINLIEAWLVIRELPVQYRAFTFFQFLCTTLTIILLISYFQMGVLGAILGELIGLAIWTMISLLLLVRRSTPSIGIVNWREVSRYCLPVLPHIFFMWGLSAVDRIMLELHGVPLSEIGVYDTAYKLASVLSMIIMAMRAAWLPNYFKTAHHSGAGERYVGMATLVVSIILFVGLATTLFAPELVSLVSVATTADYGGATSILRLIVPGFVCFGFFVVCNQPLFFERRVLAIACVSGIGFTLNLSLNLMLIPLLGITGSAWATTASYALIAIAMFCLVTKTHRFNWPVRQLAGMICFAIGLALIGMTLPDILRGWAFIVKLAILLLFPLCLIFEIRIGQDFSLSIKPRFKLEHGGLSL